MNKLQTMFSNGKTLFQKFCKLLNDNKLFIMLIVFFGVSVYMGYSISQYNYTKHADEYRLENVKEYIYNPSMYQVDTLYKKCGDTLFIDTVMVNYRK